MASMCKELRVLPRAGGLLDQDSYQIWLMQIVMSAWAEKEEQDYKKKQAEAKTQKPR